MRILMTLIVSLAMAPAAVAHGLFIFPNDGQDEEQQDLDEFQCIREATRQTGFDPIADADGHDSRT